MVYAVIQGRVSNLGCKWMEYRAEIRATIYDK